MKVKEPIRLRKKKLTNGGYSLYLDYYINGKRTFEFLKLYLNPQTDTATKAKNKSALDAAKMIQAKRLIAYQENSAGIISSDKRQMRMADWMDKVIADKESLDKDYITTLRKVKDLWIEYIGSSIRVCDIDTDTIRGFAKFLRKHDAFDKDRLSIPTGACRIPTPADIKEKILDLHAMGVSQRGIAADLGLPRTTICTIIRRDKIEKAGGKPVRKYSETTISGYFDRLSTYLNLAVKEGIITHSPMAALPPNERPKPRNTHRQYLTMDELAILAKTDCKHEMSKQMFMFCCFSGVRYSDCCNVTWRMIEHRKIMTTQVKTGKDVIVPLTDNALMWIPQRNGASSDDKVFEGHLSLSTIDIDIHKWVADAGIEKKISFHCSRHTFATLLITYGADLYTTSKLLGHSSIAVTEIYAKVIDKKKEEAVSLIPEMK